MSKIFFLIFMAFIVSCSGQQSQPARREVASTFSDVVDKMDGTKIVFKDGSSTVKVSVGDKYDPRNRDDEKLYTRIMNLENAVERLQFVVYNMERENSLKNSTLISALAVCNIEATYSAQISDNKWEEKKLPSDRFKKELVGEGRSKAGAVESLNKKIEEFKAKAKYELGYLILYDFHTKCESTRFE